MSLSWAIQQIEFDINHCTYPSPCAGCDLSRKVLDVLRETKLVLRFYANNDPLSVTFDPTDNGERARKILGIVK